MAALPLATTEAATAVLAHYGLRPRHLEALTGGLINLSLKVGADNGNAYVLQRLHPVFDITVNENLELVARALHARGELTPRLIRTRGNDLAVIHEGEVWRLLSHVPGASVAQLHDPAQARAAGELLGRFHATLAEWTVPLPHTRAGVHEPARHLALLVEALRTHPAHRLHAEVARLAEHLFKRIGQLPAWPTTPVRLVHGDPKISNLLFDADGRGLCMVDLDTLARGPLVPELGDAFRSWCNPGPEDARKAGFSLPLLDAALAGYAVQMREHLTLEERLSVVAGTETVYLELAARFAADALAEAYFGWAPERFASRGDHNLARARNQLAAAGALAGQASAAEALVARHLG